MSAPKTSYIRRSERLQLLRRKMRAARRSRGRSQNSSCLPYIKRRRRRRTAKKDMGVSPIRPPSGLRKQLEANNVSHENEQRWLISSEGIKHAKVLMCEGKITIDELKEIVKGDKKYYSLTNPSGHQNNVDSVCPISLQPFKAGPYDTVVLVDPVTECQIMYDTKSLGEYLIASGCRVCPVQRRRYSDSELQMIDEFLRQIDFAGGSVVEAVNNLKMKEENKFRTEALIGLDNLIADCLKDIFKLLEDTGTHRSQKFTKFLIEIMPNFEDLFMQIMTSDARHAQICLEQYISRLKGPPNRPTKDPDRILPRILDTFESYIQKSEEKRGRTTSADSIMDVPQGSISERVV